MNRESEKRRPILPPCESGLQLDVPTHMPSLLVWKHHEGRRLRSEDYASRARGEARQEGLPCVLTPRHVTTHAVTRPRAASDPSAFRRRTSRSHNANANAQKIEQRPGPPFLVP
jgi:hypothetical protein